MDDFHTNPPTCNETNKASFSLPPSSHDILNQLNQLAITSFAGWTHSHPSRSSLKFYYYPVWEDWTQIKRIDSRVEYEYFCYLIGMGKCDHLWVYLNPQSSTSSNWSPPKGRDARPPAIDCVIANLHRNVPKGKKSPPGSSLSPDSANLTTPEREAREEQFKEELVERDFDEEKKMGYCVFCGEISSSLIGCHLWPVGVQGRKGRLGMTRPRSVGHLNSTMNGVLGCAKCHDAFDDGKFWVELNNEGKHVIHIKSHPLLIHDEHLHRIHHRVLRLPVRANKEEERMLRLDFPNEFAWKWRREWAEKAFPLWVEEQLRKQEEKEKEKDKESKPFPQLESKFSSLSISSSSSSSSSSPSSKPISKMTPCKMCKLFPSNKKCTILHSLAPLCAKCCGDAGGCSFHENRTKQT
jgi:hypothetical protein